MSVKMLHWSKYYHKWMHHAYFETVEQAESYVRERGYNAKDFRSRLNPKVIRKVWRK